MSPNKIDRLTAHFPDLAYGTKAWQTTVDMRYDLNKFISELLPELQLQGESPTQAHLAEDVHVKNNEVLIKRVTTMMPAVHNNGFNIKTDVFSHLEAEKISLQIIQKFTDLATDLGATKIMHNSAVLLPKIGKLSIATQAITASVGLVSSYQDAAEKIQPFVDSKDVSPETARDYAAAAAQTAVINSSIMAADLSLATIPLAQWVHEHPEVPSKVLDELGLGQIREMQNQMMPSAPEIS